MNLAAMVGLVIEHMGDEDPARLGHFADDGAREVGLVGGQAVRSHGRGPVDDDPIKGFALRLQIFPIGAKRDGFRNSAVRFWRVSEPAHPNPIAPQQMTARLMDRAEEGAALALAFLYGQPVGDAVEIVVLPAIVARYALYISTGDHGVLISVMAGPVPAIHVLFATK